MVVSVQEAAIALITRNNQDVKAILAEYGPTATLVGGPFLPGESHVLDLGTDTTTERYLGLDKQLPDPDRVLLGFDWPRPAPCDTSDAHNAVTLLFSLVNREARFPAVWRSPPSAGSLLSCVARRVADPDSPVPLITLLGMYMLYRAAPRFAAAGAQASACRATSRLDATT